MSAVHIRPAVLEDREAVINIREGVYAGRDYIPSFYNLLVNSTNCFPFVAVIDDEIVGFCAAFLVDDMKTLVTRAARVSPHHGGRGVYKLLMDSIKAKARVMGAIHYSFTTNSGNPAIHMESFQKQNRHILTKDGLPYSVNGLQWKPWTDAISTSTLVPGPRVPTDNDLKLYISSEQYVKYLFPEGVLIVDWVPYKLINSNLNIAREYENIIMLSDVTMDEGKPAGMLSIATVFECASGDFGCNIDVYGSDTSAFKQHLVHLLEFITARAKGPTSLVIFVDSSMNVDAIRQAGDDIGLVKSRWVDPEDESIEYNKIILYESGL